MKRFIQGMLLAGSLVVGGSALAQGAMAEHMGYKVPTDEKALLERLHQANQTEVKLGRLAAQNAQSPEVKTYGDTLVKDHGAADEKVLAYAKKKGLTLAEPKPLDEVERKSMAAGKAMEEKLQVLKGQPFDACFMADMVGDHDADLGKLTAAQQSLTDAGLKPLLQEMSQTVRRHRQDAYTLLGRVGPGATAGIGGSGDMNQDMNPGMSHDMDNGGNKAGDTNKGTMKPGGKNTLDPGSTKKY
jgi:putative membrane protein